MPPSFATIALFYASGVVAVQPFELRAPGGKTVLLQGAESVIEEGAFVTRHTEYKNRQGEVAQTEDFRYDSASLRMASYRFDDRETGEMAAVDVYDGKAKTQYRALREDTVQESTMPWDETTLSGKAIPMVLLQSFARLQAGKSVEFDLYVPFKMTTFGFRAVRDSGPEAAPVKIRVEASNWLIRQFAPTIYFTFDTSASPPKLVRYEGPAAVAIDGEKHRAVEIQFP